MEDVSIQCSQDFAIERYIAMKNLTGLLVAAVHMGGRQTLNSLEVWRMETPDLHPLEIPRLPGKLKIRVSWLEEEMNWTSTSSFSGSMIKEKTIELGKLRDLQSLL